MIHIKFNKNYRGFKKGFEFTFQTDKSIVLVGDNGSGKSTIINMILAKALVDETKIDVENKSNDLSLAESLHKLRLIQKAGKLCNIPANKTIFIEDYIEGNAIVTTDISNFTARLYKLDMNNLLNNDVVDDFDSAENLAIHIDLKSVSKGESNLYQMFNLVKQNVNPETNKLNKYLLLDEPDDGISVKHAYIFTKYLDPNLPGKIISVHNPIYIDACDTVYWINKPEGSEYVDSINMISGKEYIQKMKTLAQKTIDLIK